MNKCINDSDYIKCLLQANIQEPIQLYDVQWIPNTQEGLGSG